MQWFNRKDHLPEKENLCLIHATFGGQYGYDQYFLGVPDLENRGFACGDEMIYTRCEDWLPFEGNQDLGYAQIEIVSLDWAYIEDIDQILTVKSFINNQ